MNHVVDWARTLGGLFVVLAMIVAAGWLLRRLQHRAGMGPGARRGQVISVVAQQMLGAREKVVVVDVEGTWLVLGVTQQHVQTLHTLPRPADAATAATHGIHSDHNTGGTKPPSFADALSTQLKRRLMGKSE